MKHLVTVTLMTLCAFGTSITWADTAVTDYTPTVLITGANRGLGFEFTRQYAVMGWNVIATARKPDGAEALQELAGIHDNISVEQLEESEDS